MYLTHVVPLSLENSSAKEPRLLKYLFCLSSTLFIQAGDVRVHIDISMSLANVVVSVFQTAPTLDRDTPNSHLCAQLHIFCRAVETFDFCFALSNSLQLSLLDARFTCATPRTVFGAKGSCVFSRAPMAGVAARYSVPSLLFSKDGTEYCVGEVVECRAEHGPSYIGACGCSSARANVCACAHARSGEGVRLQRLASARPAVRRTLPKARHAQSAPRRAPHNDDRPHVVGGRCRVVQGCWSQTTRRTTRRWMFSGCTGRWPRLARARLAHSAGVRVHGPRTWRAGVAPPAADLRRLTAPKQAVRSVRGPDRT